MMSALLECGMNSHGAILPGPLVMPYLKKKRGDIKVISVSSVALWWVYAWISYTWWDLQPLIEFSILKSFPFLRAISRCVARLTRRQNKILYNHLQLQLSMRFCMINPSVPTAIYLLPNVMPGFPHFVLSANIKFRRYCLSIVQRWNQKRNKMSKSWSKCTP